MSVWPSVWPGIILCPRPCTPRPTPATGFIHQLLLQLMLLVLSGPLTRPPSPNLVYCERDPPVIQRLVARTRANDSLVLIQLSVIPYF